MRSHGFTLLEVLVAMLVLSIGLLGLAGLMAANMRNNHSAYHRSQATWLAYDLIDRIRVNRANALLEQYDIAFAAPTSSSTGIAKIDIDGWKATLARALPVGDGFVDVVPATRAVSVIIRWDDSRGTSGSNAQEFRMDTQL